MKIETTKEKILEAAVKCQAAKETLEILFPEVFVMDPFEEVCQKIGVNWTEWVPYKDPQCKMERQLNGGAKLALIRQCINPPGYDPDYSNPDEPKWKCVWEYKAGSGFVFGGSLTSYVCTYANGGPLLDCVDKATADLFATKFRREWLEWLEG